MFSVFGRKNNMNPNSCKGHKNENLKTKNNSKIYSSFCIKNIDDLKN